MKKTNKIKYFSILMLVALVINVTLPFFITHDTKQALAAQNADTSLSSPFTGKILICTIDGFKWVNLADVQNNDEHPEPHSKYECALCYIIANSVKHIIPTQELAIFYNQHINYVYAYSAELIALTQLADLGFHTRAPPHIS